MAVINTALHGLAAGAVLISAYTDLRWRQIPNWLLVIVSLWGLMLRLDNDVGYALIRSTVVVIVLMPVFVLRGVGAGDVKLLALLAFLLEPTEAQMAIVLAILAGGVMGLIEMARRSHRGIPYALPILIGTAITIF